MKGQKDAGLVLIVVAVITATTVYILSNPIADAAFAVALFFIFLATLYYLWRREKKQQELRDQLKNNNNE